MKSLAKLLFAVAILAVPTALFAQVDDHDLARDDTWNITGTIRSIDAGRKSIDIYDGAYLEHSVDAENARVYDQGKQKKLSDLREGDRVRIYGNERGNYTVDARTIYKMNGDYGTSFDDANSVRFHGTISSIDKGNKKLRVSIEGSLITVDMDRDARVYSSDDREVGIDYLGKGDQIALDGYRKFGNDIRVYRIQVEGSVRWNGDDGERRDTVNLRVVKDTSMFNRMLRVSPDRGGQHLPDVFDLDVAKGAQVTRYGKGVSVHDIRTGDLIRVDITRTDNGYRTERVDIIPDSARDRDDQKSERDYHAVDGRIVKIDYDKYEFKLDTRDGEMDIYADRARVWIDGRLSEFERLRRGDQVSIRGNVDGRSVDAERIDTGNGDRYSGGHSRG